MIRLYRKPIQLLLFIVILAMNNFSLNAQCTFGGNTSQFPVATFDPGCSGAETVTTCNFGGDYFLMSVVNGDTYTVSTCGGSFDSQITVYNNASQVQIGYNDDACSLQSTVTFTATFTGLVRVLINQYNCTTNSTCITTQVTRTASLPGVPTQIGWTTVNGTSFTVLHVVVFLRICVLEVG